MELEATVLIDNNSRDALLCEWGLSFHIRYGGRSYLLDTGGSEKFLSNAGSLGIELSEVDAAVLSHAHYDHSLGMDAFFAANLSAPFYLSPDAEENCWSKKLFSRRYIGLPHGVLERHHSRIERPGGVFSIADGVWVVPHSAPGKPSLARKGHLYVRRDGRFRLDGFAHEQSLVFETSRGLVIFNSCSHTGPEVIVSEVRSALPGSPVHAYVGGLHLFRHSDRGVRKVAAALRGCGVERIYTGHCTGDRAFGILKECLGGAVEQFYSGMVISC